LSSAPFEPTTESIKLSPLSAAFPPRLPTLKSWQSVEQAKRLSGAIYTKQSEKRALTAGQSGRPSAAGAPLVSLF